MVLQIVSNIRKLGGRLYLEENQLKLDIDDVGLLSQELREEIGNNKTELISFLTSLKNNAFQFIPKLEQQESYKLSSSQNRLWVLNEFQTNAYVYNEVNVLKIEGNLMVKAFEEAFLSLIARHESLRTIFKKDKNEEVRQWILPKHQHHFKLKYNDVRNQNHQERVLQDLIAKEFKYVFNLEEDALLRATLIQTSDNSYVLVFVMHHIISDDWSRNVLVRDLLTYYNGLVNKTATNLPELRIHYKDYAAWQQKTLKNDTDKGHPSKDYWLDQFNSELPVLNLPLDKQRPAIQTFNGGAVTTVLNKETVEQLKQVGKETGATLFMSLLASVNVLLHKYSSQSDIVIGSPIAGRDHSDLNDQIGFYLNTIALRNKVNPKDGFKALLQSVKNNVLNAYEHQNYPFDELVEHLDLQRNMSRNPLFDVWLVLHNVEDVNGSEGFEGVQITPYEIEGKTVISKFDLSFSFTEIKDEINVVIEYNSDLFLPTTVERLSSHLTQLIQSVSKTPSLPLEQISYLSKAEQQQLLLDFNNTQANYPNDKTIATLFEDQVNKTPNKVALVCQETQLTYSELNDRANQLANYLRKQYAIQPDDLVAITLERSEWMIISVLAVLKSGGAYVPVDPDYPQERKAYMLKDSNARVVINQTELDKFIQEQDNFDTSNLEITTTPANLAYVIYTSGSTGKPKGVLVENKSVANYLCYTLDHCATSEIVCPLYTSLSFDLTVTSIFMPLITGGQLIVEQELDAAELISSVTQNSQVNVLKLTPSHVSLLKEHSIKNENIASFIIGGEALSKTHVETLKKISSKATIFNEYGPTETTVGVVVKKLITENDKISIGHPIANTRIYILDDQENLLPIGVVGEICISGDGLAKGYLNRPDLTAKKFVPNPFEEGKRMYKSGDLGRWLSDGTIEFIGRKDDQVKLKGYRIELGEIEAALHQYELVEESAVLVKKSDTGVQQLVAYLRSDQDLNTTDLRTHLNEILPDYMIPSHFVQLTEFPLTINGKLDKKGFPNPEGLELSSGSAFETPNTNLEKQLAKIWSEVLQVEEHKISVHDDFFALGGDSIRAIMLVSNLKNLGYTDLTIAKLFDHPTINKLATFLPAKTDSKEDYQRSIEEITAFVDGLEQDILALREDKDNIRNIQPMTEIQKGMCLYTLMAPQLGIYHEQMVQPMPKVDTMVLEQALNLLVEKHEILRAQYNLYDYQEEVCLIYKQNQQIIPHEDLSGMSNAEIGDYLKRCLAKDLKNPFKVHEGALWNVKLFTVSETQSIFIFQFHHSIIDGWSDKLFRVELWEIYKKLIAQQPVKLEPFGLTWKEITIQALYERGNKTVTTFWKEYLSNYNRLNIFKPSFTNEQYKREYDQAYLEKLVSTAKKDNLSIKSIILSSYVYALNIISHERDITLGLVGHTRPTLSEAEDILGCFLNTIPFRVQLEYQDDNNSIKAFVDKINNALQAHSGNSKMSLRDIADVSNEKAEIDQNLFSDVMFNYVDFHSIDRVEEDLSNFNAEDILVDSYEKTNYFFELTVGTTLNRLSFNYKKNKRLKGDITLSRFHEFVESFLNAYLKEEDICQIPNLNEKEEKQLLIDLVQPAEPPLTTNGKSDKQEVPQTEELGQSSPVDYLPPNTEIEKTLVRIWSEVLGMEESEIGIQDDFFDLGGHSLKAMRIINLVSKEFAVELSMVDLFENASVENIGQEIEQFKAQKELSIQSLAGKNKIKI